MGFIPTEEHDSGGYIKTGGQYNLQLKSIETGKISKGQKTNGCPVQVLVLADTDCQGIVKYDIIDSDLTRFQAVQFAKACGVQIAKGEELEIDESWIGKTCKSEISINEKGYPDIDSFTFKVDSLFKEGAAPAKTANAKTAKPAFDDDTLDEDVPF